MTVLLCRSGVCFECSDELVAFRPLIDWLLDSYVGRPRPNGTWSQPLFCPDQWNVYQRTLDGAARTNNNAEADHHRLRARSIVVIIVVAFH
ncbi:hypothetical protein niasHS_009280 [Heterodera schachtii]|uniref:Uncharacterized protein n=1 Tax=Heterodera schachtii TaxID=97005 RepID=A0ABD2IX59_HETSC